MIRRTLKEIEQMVGGTGLNSLYESLVIEGVSIDSRTTEKHNLYIPIVGERFNGHHFVDHAIKNGATATLWNEDEPIPPLDIAIIYVNDTLSAIQQLAKVYRQQLSTTVIGITGSNGKTSTKDILASLLGTKYKTQKTFGNLNNHLGVPLTLLQLEEDTEMAVVEMGMSNLGEIELLASISAPDVAIITTIGEAHLENLLSKSNIVKAKLEIVTGLKEGGLLVYNGDEPLLREALCSSDSSSEQITYGLLENNFYYPQSYEIANDGMKFTINKQDAPPLFLPMLGKHQMINSIGAIAVARYFGLSYFEIGQGLGEINVTGMRNELIHNDRFTIMNDTYKSNPTSLLAALDTLYSLCNYSQKIVILGDMNGLGLKEIEMHEQIGSQIKPTEIDYVFTLGPLARHIAIKAKDAFTANRVYSYLDKAELIAQLKSVIIEKGIILVKGSREMQLEKVVENLQEEFIVY